MEDIVSAVYPACVPQNESSQVEYMNIIRYKRDSIYLQTHHELTYSLRMLKTFCQKKKK